MKPKNQSAPSMQTGSGNFTLPEPVSPDGAASPYNVFAPLDHDNHHYAVADTIYLSESEAAPLIEQGKVAPLPERQKVLTRADIAKMNEGNHRCGWTTGAVKNPNPACGCMCGTVYAPDGNPIISHGERHSGVRCKHADERGRLIAHPEPVSPEGSAEDEIDALINEVAPPPLVVSETAIRQLRPLLLELIARRKAEELIQELVDALKGVMPYMEQVETAGLVGHEGCHWPVEFVRAALARAEDYRKGANNG